MSSDILKNIDPSKVRRIVYNFPEMTENEIEKYRKQGISDEEICRIAQKKVA